MRGSGEKLLGLRRMRPAYQDDACRVSKTGPVGICLQWIDTFDEVCPKPMHDPFPPAEVTLSGAKIFRSIASRQPAAAAACAQVAACLSKVSLHRSSSLQPMRLTPASNVLQGADRTASRNMASKSGSREV